MNVILLKAKGKENIIVWMLFTSKLSGFYFSTYCIIQSKMLIVCLVFLCACWNYHDISHNHCPHSPLHSFLIRYKEICNHCSLVHIFLFAGRKAEKKKAKNVHVQELTDKQRNPKAFTFNSAVRAERRFRR